MDLSLRPTRAPAPVAPAAAARRAGALAVVAVVVVIAVAAVAGALTAAGPALAHPFGPPPTAVIGADGDVVSVAWTATPDDLLLIGERLGYLPAGSAAASLEGAVQVAPSAVDSAALSAAPELRGYLEQRITVTQAGTVCPADVRPGLDFVTEGATLRFTCPAVADVVDLEITMLHDVHPAYRTFVVAAGGGDGQAALTVGAPATGWDVRAGGPVEPAGGGNAVPGRGAAPGGTVPSPPGVAAPGPFEERFLALVDAPPTSAAPVTLGLLVAAAVGAAHALAPGHGKTVTAAYLAGHRGRPRDAVALGVAVALMHSASTLVLGLAFAAADRSAPASSVVTPVLALAAGVVVLALGVRGCAVELPRLRRARQARAAGADDAGAHDANGHRPHGHDHALAAPLSRRGLVALGLSGGLLPSPSAFLVLATALVAGRAGLGVALVAAFSAGLALTLALVGLAALRGRALVADRAPRSALAARATAVLPAVSAIAVLAGGLLLTLRAAGGV